ncbi:tRNA (adenosine(37)-N6)-threonylcarbamoyltransferase complex dimerization subunit type 1 TsaB [Euzebyella marina]|uniref:tRNA (Adenosine(37)-N6)-threonylcarbamoyltransferase complex dimerization subunit type 1 TsaB n=1 Tax=Euzebyella marina TaxID=1761453 RepID=A0A3G2L335_9FLAO|nr:tRNA (adenosine(37)-N6)-threonylcarbamoyltransferase complex dimerization subunit type 1 TsaB [Euzebyella marina]AYN66606.1 tRNA (adenosine(37)-N6)-threonylcarbamoyltransferase complex dimerization subunit type 1 TsaB [Euzebyella marina]
MALILNLETATTNCSVSLARDGQLIALKEHNSPNYSHSEQLHVFIDEVVKQASLRLSDLDAIAISKGPGSYTGLRIGVSAAKGLCYALEIPLISIATLESMASQADPQAVDFIVPLLDARRMEVYSAVFDKDLKQVRDTRAEIVSESSFEVFWQKGKVLLLGSGAEKCKEVLCHDHISFDEGVVPSSSQMAHLAYEKYKSSEFEDVAYFEPYYLKDFILQQKKK